LSWALFIAAFIFVLPAQAADPRVERDAKALQKKAIEEDNLNVNYAAAAKKLQTAVNKCGADKCGVSLKASLLRDLGAMQLLAGNVDAGKANFVQAIRLDATLDLDPAYKNPMLEGIWADVKSKGGGGGGGAAPAASGGGGAPAAGDFTHTPPPEALVRTPLALYVEYSAGELARVVVKYKSPGASDWKTLKLKKVGDGFGALIPCGDVRQGSLQYFIQGFDAQNQPAAMSGSRTAPFSVEVKTELAGDEPSLPGKPPPAQCKDKAGAAETECPPDFPGCATAKKDVGDDCDKAAQCSSGSCVAGKCAENEKKAAGAKCEADDECSSGTCSEGECSDKKASGEYCENDNQCTSGSCEDSKCTEAASTRMPRIWIGASGQLDLYVLKAATDVCIRDNRGLNLNTAGYTCIDPSSSQQFPAPGDNANITRGAGTPNSGGGLALGNIRVVLTFDYALNANMLLGARVGYVFRTDPAIGAPGTAFPPLHIEARYTWLSGGGLRSGSVAFMAFGAVGAGEFDAYVPVTVQLSQQPMSGTCTSSISGPNGEVRCAENAWITAGPVFAALGAGARFRIGNHVAVPIAVKLEGGFGGRAGFLFGIAPELGVQAGF
jgi:hypothetical protein